MKRTALAVAAVLLALAPAPLRAGDDASLREELVRRLDARLEKEFARLRAELVAEIDRALAERRSGEPDPLPDGYPELLEEVRRLREELAARLAPAPAAPEPAAAPETVLGARVEPVPAVLRAQVELPEGARLVRAVPDGSAAAAAGLLPGDVLLEAGEAEIRVLRRGERLVLARGKR